MELYAKKDGKFLEVDKFSGTMKLEKFKELISDKFEVGDNIEINFNDCKIPFIINLT